MSDSIDPVPFLRSGVGLTPSEGGCIMQIIDWIARHQWTDQPPCVHPLLRRLAICTNDALDDNGRQALLALAPRLMNTATEDRAITVALMVWCAEKAAPWCQSTTDAITDAAYAAQSPHVDRLTLHFVTNFAAATLAVLPHYGSPDNILTLLREALDEYDRLTGRTSVPSLDYREVCAVMEAHHA